MGSHNFIFLLKYYIYGTIMQYFQLKSFLCFTLCLVLLLETTIVRAASTPMFGEHTREVRAAEARRRYRGRSYSRGRSYNEEAAVDADITLDKVGGTVWAGGAAAATGIGLLTGNNDLTN